MHALEHPVVLDDLDVEAIGATSEELSAEARAREVAFAAGLEVNSGAEELQGGWRESTAEDFPQHRVFDLPDCGQRGLVGRRPGVEELAVLALLHRLVPQGEARILRIPVHDEGVLTGRRRWTEGAIEEGGDAESGKREFGLQKCS